MVCTNWIFITLWMKNCVRHQSHERLFWIIPLVRVLGKINVCFVGCSNFPPSSFNTHFTNRKVLVNCPMFMKDDWLIGVFHNGVYFHLTARLCLVILRHLLKPLEWFNSACFCIYSVKLPFLVGKNIIHCNMT